jgi:hypothetical protein
MSPRNTTPLGNPDDHPDYALALGLSSYYVAERVAVVQGNDTRKKAMRRVAQLKLENVHESFPRCVAQVTNQTSAASRLEGLKLGSPEARTLLIDLSFSDPFAPYEFTDYDRDADMRKALKDLAPRIGCDASEIDNIEQIRREATKAHEHRNVLLMAAFGIGGAAILAVGGWMAAPAIAAYLGGAAGLTGAAATAHGLALLGGGTLAAGGFGMAGGMLVVTGAGAVLGGVAGAGGRLLFQLGAAAASAELVKLQVTFKAVLLQGQADIKKAQAVIKSLYERERELDEILTEERKLNQENAKRVKEVEKIIEAVIRSRGWMEEELAA